MAAKVLVVDDEPDFCEAIRDILKVDGYQVVEAYDGDNALAVYERERPYVVLLDAMMPGMSGLVTLRGLKALDQNVRVIMITALRDEELAKQMLAEGAVEYITKPVDHEYLGLALITELALVG